MSTAQCTWCNSELPADAQSCGTCGGAVPRRTRATVADSPLIIGRGTDCGVVLDHDGVSVHHASLERDGDALRLRDLGSRNGTFIDGRRVSSERVRPGADVRIGTRVLPWDHPRVRALAADRPKATIAIPPGLMGAAAHSPARSDGRAEHDPAPLPAPKAVPVEAVRAVDARHGEAVLLSESDVLVTTTRIVVANRTYPLQGVTAVERKRRDPNRTPESTVMFIGVLLGLLCLAAIVTSRIVPAIVSFLAASGAILIARTMWRGNATIHLLRIYTAGGQADLVASTSLVWIERVHYAISSAIASRG